MKIKTLIMGMILSASTMSCNDKIEVDMIVKNAKVYTVDSVFSKANSFAVKDGKFVAIATGSDKVIMERYCSKQVIDAQGKSIFPGFIDAHCHFVSYGENCIRYADLKNCASFDELIERLVEYDKDNESEWILGRGWDQNLWETKEFPDNTLLNNKFPNKKVLLTRIDGHAVLVTNNVLELAGLNENSVVDGGDIILNEQGKPTGILLDNAADITKNIVPELDNNQKIKALMKAQKDCFALGLTSITDAGLDISTINMIDSLQQSGDLKMNINAMINPDEETLDYFMNQGIIVKDRLSVHSVKLYADGALGSRGAKLIKPYSDAPETDGLIVNDDDFYKHVCDRAYKAGYQVCTHAIGDGGVRHILNIYTEFLKGKNDLRWRIEHSQIVDPADFDLYGQYNIIPSIQSTHCTSDMFWAVDRIGEERMPYAYAYKDLLDQNGWIINGTDFPIEYINPLYTFYAAVARKNLEGKPLNGFQLENALSREEALKSMTIWAAKGSFDESRRGSIELNKKADFIILSDDIMTIDESLIPNVKVESLVIGGEKIY